MELLDSSYAEIGLTYGLPGIINFNVGHWFGRTGVRFSGMFYNEHFAGMELHVGYKLFDNNRQRNSIGFSYGRLGSTVDDGGIGYAGLVYNYTGPPLAIRKRHHGWFVAVGYGRYFQTGNESFRDNGSFGPILQIGYMHRFIKHAPRYEVIPFPKCPKPPKKKKEKRPKIKKIIVREKIKVVRPRIKNIVVRPKIVDPKKIPDPPPCPTCPEVVPCPECIENVPCPECPECASVILLDSLDEVKNITVKNKDIVLSIRDNGFPDGDIVSIELNGEVVLSKYTLKKEEKEVPIYLDPEKENHLILIAHNVGEREPNTSVISIDDGIKNKKIILNADLKSPGVLRFVLE